MYHLPYISTLINEKISFGIANLHFRYGFYGLSFFGQVPIQSFSESSNYLSPSLNIAYLSIYFLYFMPFLRKISFRKVFKYLKGDLTFNEDIEEISIFYFLLSIIFYTGGVLSSLSSYALDLPLFICGSLTFHLIIMSLFDNDKMAAWLTEITKDPYDGKHLPRFNFKFADDGKSFQFRVKSEELVILAY